MSRRSFVSAIAASAVVAAISVEAHKPVTSKYTFNDDVFPIVKSRCAGCHVPGGVAPMSLVTYNDAYPWAESIRGELIARHMPPWNVEDGGVPLKQPLRLTPRELDTLLTWATGGTPPGNPLHEPPAVSLSQEWPFGRPDLELPLPEVTIGADVSDTEREFTMSTATSEPRWVRATDLMPGAASIVRHAVVALKSNPDAALAVWIPGDRPVSVEQAAVRIPAGAELLVRVHYKKTYKYERQVIADRSRVGLYFTADASEMRQLVASPNAPAVVGEPLRALAFYVDPAIRNARVALTLVGADGRRTLVARLSVRPDWARRYWFEQPIRLPMGSRLEVEGEINGADTLLPPAATPTPQQSSTPPLRVVVDVIGGD